MNVLLTGCLSLLEDHMKYAAYMAVSFITLFHILWFYFVSLYIWFYVLYVSVYFVNYAFLFLCNMYSYCDVYFILGSLFVLYIFCV